MRHFLPRMNAKQGCFTLRDEASDAIISSRPEGAFFGTIKFHIYLFLRRVKHSWRHDIFS